MIVYVASFVLFDILSVAVKTIIYVPAFLFAGIVIFPSAETFISESPDFFV